MSPDQIRRRKLYSVAPDIEWAYRQAADLKRHELREAAWQGWMLDNTWAFHEVAGVIESVRSRKEFMP